MKLCNFWYSVRVILYTKPKITRSYYYGVKMSRAGYDNVSSTT